MLLRARRYDERHHVLFRLEARAISRGSRLRRKRTDTHAIPRAARRYVRRDDIRLVATNTELLRELIRLFVCLERAHLELVVAVMPRGHGLRFVARLTFAHGLREAIARVRHHRRGVEDVLR